MGFVRTANRSHTFESRTEGSNESYDRTWRRWLGFCAKAGRSYDPFLNKLSAVRQEVIIVPSLPAFIVHTAQWKKRSREIVGKCTLTMVASTVREATGHLATAFWNHPQPSPMYIEGSAQLLPAARSLFNAFENADPARKRQ